MTDIVAEKLYCANHPTIETTLRCNRCEKPICPKCAVLTPTGYRCKECVRGQLKVFDTAEWYDYPLGFIVVLLGSYLGSLLAYRIGFFTLLFAPFAGAVIAELARLVVRKRRATRLFRLLTLAAFLGAVPAIFIQAISLAWFPLIWVGVYAVMVSSTVFYRLSGIELRLRR